MGRKAKSELNSEQNDINNKFTYNVKELDYSDENIVPCVDFEKTPYWYAHVISNHTILRSIFDFYEYAIIVRLEEIIATGGFVVLDVLNDEQRRKSLCKLNAKMFSTTEKKWLKFLNFFIDSLKAQPHLFKIYIYLNEFGQQEVRVTNLANRKVFVDVKKNRRQDIVIGDLESNIKKRQNKFESIEVQRLTKTINELKNSLASQALQIQQQNQLIKEQQLQINNFYNERTIAATNRMIKDSMPQNDISLNNQTNSIKNINHNDNFLNNQENSVKDNNILNNQKEIVENANNNIIDNSLNDKEYFVENEKQQISNQDNYLNNNENNDNSLNNRENNDNFLNNRENNDNSFLLIGDNIDKKKENGPVVWSENGISFISHQNEDEVTKVTDGRLLINYLDECRADDDKLLDINIIAKLITEDFLEYFDFSQIEEQAKELTDKGQLLENRLDLLVRLSELMFIIHGKAQIPYKKALLRDFCHNNIDEVLVRLEMHSIKEIQGRIIMLTKNGETIVSLIKKRISNKQKQRSIQQEQRRNVLIKMKEQGENFDVFELIKADPNFIRMHNEMMDKQKMYYIEQDKRNFILERVPYSDTHDRVYYSSKSCELKEKYPLFYLKEDVEDMSEAEKQAFRIWWRKNLKKNKNIAAILKRENTPQKQRKRLKEYMDSIEDNDIPQTMKEFLASPENTFKLVNGESVIKKLDGIMELMPVELKEKFARQKQFNQHIEANGYDSSNIQTLNKQNTIINNNFNKENSFNNNINKNSSVNNNENIENSIYTYKDDFKVREQSKFQPSYEENFKIDKRKVISEKLLSDEEFQGNNMYLKPEDLYAPVVIPK